MIFIRFKPIRREGDRGREREREREERKREKERACLNSYSRWEERKEGVGSTNCVST
jgi:hypothetical protein